MGPPQMFFRAASAALVLGLAGATQSYLSMLSHGHDFWRIALWQVGSWSYWAVAAPWIVRLAEGAPLARLGGLGVLIVLLHLPIKALLLVGLHPYTPVDEYSFGQALLVSLPYALISDPIVYTLLIVTGRAIASTKRAHEVDVRESHLAAELSRAQLEALRLEIEPHFLFNTLNSIAALIRMKDNAAALQMLIQLSELMRSTLDRSTGQFNKLADEVALVMRYVDLQRARFGDRLQVTCEIAPSCEPILVPSFLLQPLVENALRHGLANGHKGRVEIGAITTGEQLRIWVTDNGRGLPEKFEMGRLTGTGLRNVRSRLALVYCHNASLSVTGATGGGTTAQIVLPVTGPRVAMSA